MFLLVVFAFRDNMGSISNPWIFCKNLSTLIVSCTLLIRVRSFQCTMIVLMSLLELYFIIPKHFNDKCHVSKYTWCSVYIFEFIHLQVLSIGYVIGGFVILVNDPLLSFVTPLSLCKIGIFPIRSFINALILFLTPTVIVNALNSLITYLGICKRRNHYLQIVSISNLSFYFKNVSF